MGFVRVYISSSGSLYPLALCFLDALLYRYIMYIMYSEYDRRYPYNTQLINRDKGGDVRNVIRKGQSTIYLIQLYILYHNGKRTKTINTTRSITEIKKDSCMYLLIFLELDTDH